MLHSLYVENVAIIEKLKVDFSNGLNIIVGETGSGKSIILDCIELVMGERSRSEIVRKGTQKAMIVAEVSLSNEAMDILKDHGVDLDSDIAIIKRIIYKDGRSSSSISDIPCSLALISKISSLTLEINSQFSQSLLRDGQSYIKIIDEYGNFKNLAKEVAIAYDSYILFKKDYEGLIHQKEILEREIKYHQTIVSDVDELCLIDDEYTNLQDEKLQLGSYGSVIQFIDDAKKIIDEKSIVQSLKNLARILSLGLAKSQIGQSSHDKITKIVERIESSFIEIENVDQELLEMSKEFSSAKSRLEEIDDRMYAIRSISKKHNTTPDQLAKIADDSRNNLTFMSDINEKIELKKKEMLASRADYIGRSVFLSNKRKEYCIKLQGDILGELVNLRLDKARLQIDVISDEEQISRDGIDKVNFLVSMNPGTSLAPVHKTASGGEMSRFVLALKSILSRNRNLGCVIFDEIDSGTSGIVASVIGDYMVNIAKTSQVISITHNHQIVAKSKNVYRVSKKVVDIETTVNIDKLNQDSIVSYVAEMISADKITSDSIIASKNILGVNE